MFINFLKVAVRNIIKHKIYTFVNITGLALGMLCCILILLWVQDELSFDRFHKNEERLYMVVNQLDGVWGASSSLALAPVLKKDFPEIEKATRFSERNLLIKYKEQKFYEHVGFVDPDFLEMFSFPLTKGNSTSALNITESVVISEKAAKKYFKDEDPIGKVFTVNQNTNLTVTGIMKDIPANSSLTFEMLVPAKFMGEDYISTWAWETTVFVQLKDNVNVDALQTKIADTNKKYDKRVENKNVINGLQPISRIHLYSLNETGPILYIYIFSAIAIIVLLVASINFINLVTAKASIRGKEIGIRKVVGASKKYIVYQFFGETFLLSLIAFGLALILIETILPVFNELAGKQLHLNFSSNFILTAGSISIILLTTLLSGSYPALLLSSFNPVKVLKGSMSAGFKNSNIRWTLVVIQFAVSIILIVMTITMNNQMNYIRNKNLGFNREQVISINLNDQLQNKYESFKNQLLQNSSISSVTSATAPPYNIGYVNPVYWEGRAPDQYEFINYLEVDYDYLKTFEMKLTAGRDFSKEFSTDPQNYIVNEAAVSLMKMKSPIGKLFSIWQQEGKIIGVVKNFHSLSLHNEIVPVVMTFNRYVPHSFIFIRIKPENIKSSVAIIEKTWKEYVSDYPFNYEFLDDDFRNQYSNEERIESLFQYFSFLAIFISSIGLLGLAVFSAQSRTKEIGIRKIAGATVLNIIFLVLKDFFKWLIVSIVIAVPVAYYAMNKWLENFAYRIEITWWMFALAGGIALAIALATVSFQAIKAATANPVDALKYE